MTSVEEDAQELTRLVARFGRCAKTLADALPSDLVRLLQCGQLGHRHMPVLVSVATDGPQSVGQLAEQVALQPATTSLLVGELSRAGLVRRHRDPTDRRRTIVSIEPGYAEPIRAVALQRRQILLEALCQLSQQERAHLLHGWRLVVDAAERRLPTGPAPAS